jgi:hypothetical protein
MPLLQPPGSRAPAPAPVNLEEATAGQQPDQSGEILTFGQPERRSRLLPRIRRPVITTAARIVIGSLALAAAVLDLHDAASHAPVTARTHHAPLTARTQRPPAIDVLIASAVSFPLRGTPGALLHVQYLQAGDGPAAIWATLTASGLPQDTAYYTATAGDCVNGHPRTLASASSLPDPRTDMLILPLNNLPASVPTEIWIKVTNGAGADLGSARGELLMPGTAGRAVPIPPGRPACP